MEKPQQRAGSAEESADEDVNSSSAAETKPMMKKKKNKKSKKSSSGPLDQLPVGGDTVSNAVGGVTGALGGLGGQALGGQQEGGGGGGKSDTLRLRLDLNLDIEVQLKARIHGDLELALLYVLVLSPLITVPTYSRPICSPTPSNAPPNKNVLSCRFLPGLRFQHWLAPFFFNSGGFSSWRSGGQLANCSLFNRPFPGINHGSSSSHGRGRRVSFFRIPHAFFSLFITHPGVSQRGSFVLLLIQKLSSAICEEAHSNHLLELCLPVCA